MKIDEAKVDDMVLALLYLTTFKDKPRLRAWKGHSWDALDRHQMSMTSLTHAGIGTVLTCPPFPTKSMMAQCSSHCCKCPIVR
jgi:hypothetical protein